MNAKPLIAIITLAAMAATGGRAQSAEPSDSLNRTLMELVVTAKQPATRLVGSTLVSTITGSPLADLGSALDVLAQLPLVRVDDNAVSVTGKNNIEIYIDGRPMRDDYELRNMRSTDMAKVELLMAPGAAYASTTEAVLRITTRRNLLKGLSVSDSFGTRRRRRWSVFNNLGLSYRTGGLELFANASVNRDNTLAKGSTVSTLDLDGLTTTVGSTQRNGSPVTAVAVRAGAGCTTATGSFGAYYRYNPEHGRFNNTGTEWLDDTPPLERLIDKHTDAASHLVSAYYDNTFDGRYVVHFDGDFRHSRADNSVATTYPAQTDADVCSTDRRESTLWAGKLYVRFPLGKGDFTAGTQDSHTRTSLDFRMLNPQVGSYIPSTVTEARQTSAALFASWAATFGKLSLTAGARYEYIDHDFRRDGVRDADVSRSSHLLTPDLSVGYAFDRGTELSLSYRLSTVKPPYSQLTGSLAYTGRHEIEGGNPALRDERLHSLQLFGSHSGFMLQAEMIRSIDTYAFVKELYSAEPLQLIMHPVNIDLSALSVFLTWTRAVGRWTPAVTAAMYRQWLALGDTRYNRPIFSYFFDNTLSLGRGWTVTANMSGRSRGDMHTNMFGATAFTLDASVGKSYLNKSLTVKLSANDIFNTANHNWTMRTYGVHVDKRQSYDRRGVSLDISYTFRPHRSSYKGSPASEAELQRL